MSAPFATLEFRHYALGESSTPCLRREQRHPLQIAPVTRVRS